MNSLKIKILGIMTVIMVAAMGVVTWHNLKTQKAIMNQVAEQNGRLLAETVRRSITTDMANGQNAQVADTFDKIMKEPAIESIRIFDEAGRILLSAKPEETGDLVSAADLLAYRSGKTSHSDTYNGHELHSNLVPIFNAPACYECHDSTQRILGILNVHLSLEEMDSLQNKGREAILLSTTGALTVLILAITAFILIYVDDPIRKIASAMSHLEKGDFDKAKVHIDSSDEMALLSSKFNLMGDRLKSLIGKTVQHERELAITQEKLAHHDEIRNMNITLEERLKEIEYLNITLEERIEEIEEANYKIADLASDLEDKNTNLEQAVSRLSALYDMGLAINATMDLDRLFELLLRKTMGALSARIGYILLLDRDTWSLKVGAIEGVPDFSEMEKSIPLKTGGVSHWVIENRQPLLLRNISESRDFSRVSRLGFTRETVICVPLIVKDEVIGTITMANRYDQSPFESNDLDLLSTIAAQAGIAIKNARYYDEQQNTYLNTVQALVSAIEASDAYTRGHSERVTRYSISLAKYMDIPSPAIKKLEQAAILHDIGKIGVDIAVLHKEGKLSSSDIDILQQHPIIGVRILDPIHFLKDVREIIEQHHERFDGKGYPHGFKGEDISLEARILAVVDTYDAMTSDRPYRRALSHDIAVKEIKDHAGTQFDPQVAEAFIRMCREGQFISLT